MKKLLTLITLIGTCIPAVHGMENTLPAEVEEKYKVVETLPQLEQLKACIANADALKFKYKFKLSMPLKHLLQLERMIVEHQKKVRIELAALGDDNKSSYLIAVGLVSYAVAIAGMAVAIQGLGRRGNPLKFSGGAAVSWTGFLFGTLALLEGVDYKQLLQNKLANLDAIAAHIAYEKTKLSAVAPTSRQ